VEFNNTLGIPGRTRFHANGATIDIDPGAEPPAPVRRGELSRISEARYALMIEARHIAAREDVLALEAAAKNCDFSAYDLTLSDTDKRLLGADKDRPLTDIETYRLVFARETERIEFASVMMVDLMEREMTQRGLEGSRSHRAQQNWRNFDAYFNFQIDTGHTQNILRKFDSLIAATRAIQPVDSTALPYAATQPLSYTAQSGNTANPYGAGLSQYQPAAPQTARWWRVGNSYRYAYSADGTASAEYALVRTRQNGQEVFVPVENGRPISGREFTFSGGTMGDPEPVPLSRTSSYGHEHTPAATSLTVIAGSRILEQTPHW
jgi:hypothetical protein